ncbi:phosphate ABC transporter permease PstA [Chrysiogenes arsenatis]|uniref:phosphate ABC transporter permease PstA n=1 Tax=Chrysiogenes arsenatis TaxID=309797 RepID=UPI00040CB358|nr:phosphate ABC transporter permease PstA [Chrysiogenes arsenatis]
MSTTNTVTKAPLRFVKRSKTSLPAYGNPLVWATGGALALCILMIAGLLILVFAEGAKTFWPSRVVQYELHNGTVHVGEITRSSLYIPNDTVLRSLPENRREAITKMLQENDGRSQRWLVRTGNFELTNEHFNWVSDFEVQQESYPEWMMTFERQEWGRFYGVPSTFIIDGEVKATAPHEIIALFQRYHSEVRDRWEQRRRIENKEIGKINYELERIRLEMRQAQINYDALVRLGIGHETREYRAARDALSDVNQRYEALHASANIKYEVFRKQIAELNQENARYALVVDTSTGHQKTLALADIVRAYPANHVGTGSRIAIYLSRWAEFLFDDPREANSEGGVFPAIFGTVVMTMIMSLLVVPFGVLAALYLREYAKPGPLVSTVRIAVNNLSGVPSIVFGVFGVGFFCYFVGGTIDSIFFEAKLPSPTYGTGGILWASLTLALLTLPVVIVATEESLSAVPRSMREGSYACGASKWQTIQRIVLPRAMPGIMTGMILAMARGAGEVAPLMLVGAVKLAPELPVDGIFPFFHLERSFMHLGFHIFDLGFQSQNSEAAKPMVYSTTALLIGIVALLNVTAIWLRARLRRKFVANVF